MVGRERRPVAWSIDGDLIAGVGEPIEAGVGQQGIAKVFTLPFFLIALPVRRTLVSP